MENIKANFLCGVGIENVDVVDLETAKHIKKLGFNKPTHWYWQDKTLPYVEKGYSAPTRDEFLCWVNSYMRKNRKIDSEKIWQSVLHSYDMSIDYDKRGYDAIITAIKIACDKVLDIAAENVSSKIDKQSILKIKDWIK